MNFLSIEYFTAVASERSFSKAAKRLGITQQTLSANIASLERELGCTLFIRHVPLELTYAGTVFARYAQRFRRDRDALSQEMHDIAGNRAGVLRVGVAYTRSRAIMPPIVQAMKHDRPNIIVELVEGRNDQIQQWLANGDLDLALADFTEQPAGIELIDFYDERMVLVIAQSLWLDLAATGTATNIVPDERAIASGNLSSLEHCPFLLGNPQDIDGRIADLLFRHAGFEPKIAARSDNVLTLLELCHYGMGACLCPERFLPALLDAERLRTLRVLDCGPNTTYAIKFGVPAASYRWSAIDDFIRRARRVTDGDGAFGNGHI